MIYVVATVTLQPQARQRFLAEVARLQPEVLAEHGCIEYTPAIDQASGLARQIGLRADVVTIVERWQDLAALTQHSSAPHMLSFRQRVGELVVSTSLQVLSPAAP
jgi:quinol monooxygenase YgiN